MSSALQVQLFNCRKHFRNYCVNVLLGRAVVDNARTQVELAPQGRIRQIDASTAHDLLQNLGIAAIQIIFAGRLPSHVAKTNCGQFREYQ